MKHHDKLIKLGFEKEGDMYYRRLDPNVIYYLDVYKERVTLSVFNTFVEVHQVEYSMEEFDDLIESGNSIYSLFTRE